MKNSIRILMVLSITLLVSCGKVDSENTTGRSINQDFQARDVILEKGTENRLRARWTAPVEAGRVDYYLVELRSTDTATIRRASAEKTELEIAVPSGNYQTSVAVVADGIVEPGVVGNQQQSVETQSAASGDVEMAAVDLQTVITSAEHASIEVNWKAPLKVGKTHEGGVAELKAYILYWKKGTEVGTNNYEGTKTVKRDAVTGYLATNAIIEELTPDSDYAVRVVVENTAELRSMGMEQTIKTAKSLATAPSAPVIQEQSIESIGLASDAILSFRWTVPASHGTDYKGNPVEIREYRVYWKEGASVSAETDLFLTLLKEAASVSIPGLKNETKYTFIVVVEASGGLNTESAAQTYTTAARTLAEAPAAVSNFTATAVEHALEITLEWNAHVDSASGKKVDGAPAFFETYHLYWIEGDKAVYTGDASMRIASNTETNYRITKEFLGGGTDYTISIVAENSDGLRSEASIQQVQTKDFASAPSTITPMLTSTVIGHVEAEIEVRWNAPNDPGKDTNNDPALIEKYILTWIEGTTIPTGKGTTQELSAEAELRLIIGDLESGKNYTVAVAARNTAGQEGIVKAVTERIPASKAMTPGVVTELVAAAVGEGTEQTTALKLSWNAPNSFGKAIDGTAFTLGKYQIYLQAASELGTGESVDVSGYVDYTTENTEHIIPAENLDGGTVYRLAVVVMNSDGVASEAVEVEGIPHDLTAAPTAVVQIYVDTNHMEPNEIKIYWEPVSGKNKNGAAVVAEYQIYKGESSNRYADAQDLISRVGTPSAIEGSTTETVNGNVRVVRIIEGLTSNIRYDIVVIAVHSENAELKSVPTLKTRVLSNGISQFALLQGQVELGDNTELDLEVGNKVTLNVNMELHNVAAGIQWLSMDETIATVRARSAGTETADVTAESIGRVKIRATSETDVTKFAEVTITVRGTDVSESTLSYDADVDVQMGKSKTVSIHYSEIPEAARVVYALNPTIVGVEVDPDTGRITAGADLMEGNYKFTVVATVPADNASYTGKVSSNQITLRVQRSKIVYKPISVKSRNVFSAGDANNPWLFVVRDLDAAVSVSEASADISIVDQQDSQNVLYEHRNIAADGFEYEGEMVIGFGPSIGSWAAITVETLRIEVVVYVNYEEIDRRTLDVEKGITGGIYGWRDLQKMSENLAGDYVLQNDIDFPVAGTYGFLAKGFEPIGRDNIKGNDGHQGTVFSGTLDGGGHSIKGLVVNDAALDYAGLFGKIEADTAETEVVKNLVLEDPNIKANAMAGTVVGYLSVGTIVEVAVRSTSETSGVWTDGEVEDAVIDINLGDGSYTGGLVGALSSGGVLQCSSEVSVSGLGDSTGGLVGYNEGTVTGYTEGAVSGDFYVGGLVGLNKGTVTGYTTGSILGGSSVGGLVGYSLSNRSAVTGYAMGAVTGNNFVNGVGGLVGNNVDGGTVTGYVRGTVEKKGSGSSDYGLLVGVGRGKGYYSFAESSFVGINKDEVTGFSGKPLPMKEETTEEAFDLLDFKNGAWHWVADGQWPAIDIGEIKPIEEQPTERSDSEFPEDTCDTAEENRPEFRDGFYQIDNWKKLQWMENCLYANYKLIADITMPVPGQENMPYEGFNPVGNNLNQFTGHFDGSGYRISGFSIIRPESEYVGLFGFVYGGRVENLHIEHSGIAGNAYVGTVVGYAAHAEIKEVSMESKNAEVVSGGNDGGSLIGSNIGALVGRNDKGTIIGYATGAVSGNGIVNKIGGLVGKNDKGTVIGYATGTVSGNDNDYAGGLVGENNNGGIVTGYATGVVLGTASYAGGLVGMNDSGGIIMGYATGTVSGYWNVGGLVGINMGDGIIMGYATGALSGYNSMGGLVGWNKEGTVTGYWDKETTSVGDAGIGISSTANIYYYVGASENPGRQQYKYYDMGTGDDLNNKDAEDDQIFNDGDFASIFDLPEADGVWPKLEESFTVGGRTITLTDVIYNEQDNVVNWSDPEE